MSINKRNLPLLLMTLLLPFSLNAQNAEDVLRYNFEYPSYDPVSLVMPAVTNATGFGGFQDNPASMGFVDESYFSFDLSNRSVEETGRYLGNSSEFSDNQTSIGDLGFVYSVPTIQGSFVVGGGYSQSTDFNRAVSGNGFNQQSTLTDFYASLPRSDQLNNAAYNAYAIEDVVNAPGDTVSVSIFRLLPEGEEYRGINQDFELTEGGRIGEYSTFFATEFLKNMTVGASVGLLSGNYSLEREFLESDRQENYNDQFIDADGDGEFETDIDRILNIDTINADIQALIARAGLVYAPIKNLRLGVSYQFPSMLSIEETYNTKITTTFDNDAQTETEEAPGEFSYKIRRPQRAKGGLSVSGAGLTLAGSVEYVPYTKARIEYDELEFNDQEREINNTIRSSVDDQFNLRGGLEYSINDRFIPRIGYAYIPNPQKGIEGDRQLYNAGFSARFTENMWFDVGVQYTTWNDQNQLYSYEADGQAGAEVVMEDVQRLHVMAGIRIGFN